MSHPKTSIDGVHDETDPFRTGQARLAVVTRHHGANSDQARSARRDYAAVWLEEQIQRKLATAPPLSEAQLDRLAGLFRPASAGVA